MILTIENLLSSDQLATVRQMIAEGSFGDGRLTARDEGKDIKHNEQLDPGPQLQAINKIFFEALRGNEKFDQAAAPKVVRPFLVSKTGVGGTYGVHMDSVVMFPQGQHMRTDVGMTIFLSDPDDYEGGELVLYGTEGADEEGRRIKLPAGSMVFYPPVMLHEVAPVTKGERLVAVTWAQSMIRRPDQREILYDLFMVRKALYEQSGRTREFERLTRSYLNLMRQWLEP